MPLRSDPSLWFNLPGVVAAYQPVRAPDSLSARYNMAHGGDNRYRAEPGTLPTWSAATGWSFSGTQYLMPGIVVDTTNQAWTVFFRYKNYVFSGNHALGFNLAGTGGLPAFGVEFVDTTIYFGNGDFLTAQSSSAGLIGDDVIGVSGTRAYVNGRVIGSAIPAQAGTITTSFPIGARQYTILDLYFNAKILTTLLVNRPLSAAEVWRASRQMQYCDVNPDWSVWSPRRKWYPYVLAGGFQAAWAERANRLIGGG